MIKAIANKIHAGYSGLMLVSYEEQRVEGDIATVAKNVGFDLHTWSLTKGIVNMKTGIPIPETQDPLAALAMFEQMVSDDYAKRSKNGEEVGANIILVMRDFHLFTEQCNPLLIRRVKEAVLTGRNSNRVLIILGCRLAMAKELEKEFTVIEVKLPDREQLLELANTIAASAGIELNGSTEALLDSASGLTTLEAADAMALALVEGDRKEILPAVVAREKAATLKKNGILEIIDVKVNRASVGGLTRLMPWIDKRVAAFSKEAKTYGLPTPKGFLGIGIPGCGKSLVAKVTASILGLPLLRLDAGRLFGSHVGESEANLRSVIQTVEAIAPCVLYIDEAEKGLGGSKSSGQTDGGTAGRVFGTFLQWMQDKTAPVFVVATANDVTSLPPEFQRKGRFDEVWFFDLPTSEEREDIWKIQIQKYGRKTKGYDLRALATATDNWTGSEIEALYVEGLYAAFDNDRKEPTTELLVTLAKDVVPLSKTMAAQVEALREWAKGKARKASEPITAVAQGKGRKLTA